MGQSTAIGRGFERSKPALGLALAIAGAALAVDLLVLDPHSRYRFAVSLVAVAGLLLVARGDRATLGLVVRVEPRPGYWVKATLLAGLAVLCFAGLAARGGPLFADTRAAVYEWFCAHLKSGCQQILAITDDGVRWNNNRAALTSISGRVGIFTGSVPSQDKVAFIG